MRQNQGWLAPYFSHPLVSVGHREKPSFCSHPAAKKQCETALWFPPPWWQWVQGGTDLISPCRDTRLCKLVTYFCQKGVNGAKGNVNFNFTSLIQGSVSQNPTFAKVVTLDLAGSWTNIPIWLSRFISTRGMCAKKKKRLNRIQSLTV